MKSTIYIINNINEFVRFGMIMKNFPITIVNWSTNRIEISKPQLSLGFNYFKNKCKYILLHDADYFPFFNLWGKNVKKNKNK